jgi:hypothetical protein
MGNAKMPMLLTHARALALALALALARTKRRRLKKIKLLTSQMYSFWTRANGMPVLGLLRDWIDQNCARAVNPHTREVTGGGPKGQLKWLQAASLDREVARWGDENSRITGDFWVVEQRDDGAVLVSRTQQGLVCLGLGIADSICKVLPPTSYANPVCVHLTLLPFKRRLVYDGVLHAIACGDSPRDLEERVMKAEASGAVVRCIPYPPAETQEDRQRLQAAGSLPTKSDEGVAEQVRTQYRELLAQLAALPRSTPPTSENAPDPGSWVLRRMGYSEEGNPNHMGMIMAGSGLVLGPFFCAALEPTPEELLQAVVETAVRVGRRPWCVMIDAESAVQRVQQVLEQADVKVAYYPPPSQEEQDAIQNF